MCDTTGDVLFGPELESVSPPTLISYQRDESRYLFLPFAFARWYFRARIWQFATRRPAAPPRRFRSPATTLVRQHDGRDDRRGGGKPYERVCVCWKQRKTHECVVTTGTNDEHIMTAGMAGGGVGFLSRSAAACTRNANFDPCATVSPPVQSPFVFSAAAAAGTITPPPLPSAYPETWWRPTAALSLHDRKQYGSTGEEWTGEQFLGELKVTFRLPGDAPRTKSKSIPLVTGSFPGEKRAAYYSRN